MTTERQAVIPGSTKSWIQERRIMNLSQAIAEIISRGYTGAVVQFSGGNDEGGAELIHLTKGEERLELTPIWLGEGAETDELSVFLTDMPHDQYGSFAGDYHVYGTITIDTANREKPVAWSVEESVEIYESKSW